jgi:succinate dehydrogenase / fumarate reductase cytochrome b subunit
VAGIKEPYLGSPRTREDEPGAEQVKGYSYFSSTIGTKTLLAVTGLLLALYLVLHLIGNLLIYLGPSTFNAYGHFLVSNPLIVPVEIGLLAIFVIHIYRAVTNWWTNRKARPIPYYQSTRRLFGYGWTGKPSRKSVASTTMIVSGLITIIFVVVHVDQFKLGPEYVTTATSGTPGIRDLYRLVVESFGSAAIVAFYVLCLTILGFHLWHGISSALNSLGADHPRYTPTLLRISRVLAIVVAAGFLTIPLWVYFVGVRG